MKEYEKLAEEYVDHDSDALFTYQEMVAAYESAFLKAREMALNFGVDTNDDGMRIYKLSDLENLGEKEV